MFRAAVALFWLALAPLAMLSAAAAQEAPVSPGDAAFGTLYDLLKMDEMMQIMREEGLDYGADLEADMFPGGGGAAWDAALASIYAPETMEERFATRFREAMAGTETAPLEAFFRSDLGQRIVALELSARRALLDEAVEDASKETLSRMIAEDDPRLDVLEEFAAVNDLIESNVVGGLNSNYAFYLGLVDGGAFPYDISEPEILADVWGQEQTIRADTEEWLYSYLAMAYQPLSDADLAAYIAFSRSAEGKALNRAMFAGFDVMFTTISRDLGRGAAQFLAGEEL